MISSFEKGNAYRFQTLADSSLAVEKTKSSMCCVCFPLQAIGHMLMSLVFCNKPKTICPQGSEDCGLADHARNGASVGK